MKEEKRITGLEKERERDMEKSDRDARRRGECGEGAMQRGRGGEGKWALGKEGEATWFWEYRVVRE